MQPYKSIRRPYDDMLPSTDRRARRIVKRGLKRADKCISLREELRAEEEALETEIREMVEIDIHIFGGDDLDWERRYWEEHQFPISMFEDDYYDDWNDNYE